MKIVVSEIPDEGLELDLEELVASKAIGLTAPVRAHLRLLRSGVDVIVSGSLTGQGETLCSRCLKAFSLEVNTPIDVVYHPSDTIKREEHYELKRDELDAGFYRNDEFDTDELLTEQFLLNVPMQTLCSPDCKGICPRCGADLNLTQCACANQHVDPRFDILRELLKKKE